MKKLNKKQESILVNGLALLSLILILLLSSCNKEFPDTLRIEYPNDTTNLKEGKRKVLYIILDGVRGRAISTLLPTNINILSRNSIYTYDGLNDYEANPTTTNAASWANMTTGVNPTKHKITSEDFVGNDLVNYPSLFTRLKSVNVKYRMVSIAASESFNTKLAIDATDKQTRSTDAEVKDALINELKNKDADLIVAQFHSAETAGATGGYETTNAAYTSAVTTLDGYIGNVITELKARPNYNKENWLVVIASNKGGIDVNVPANTDLGAYGDTRRNNFVIYYNPQFSTQPLIKPDVNSFAYTGFGPKFVSSATSTGTATLNNTTIGNIGTSGDYTLMFKIKYLGTGSTPFPIFLSKRDPANLGSGTGWTILFGTTNIQLNWTGITTLSPSVNVKDGIWHAIAFKVYNNAGTRTVALFFDGKNLASGNIQGRNIDNPYAMRIGADINSNTNFLLKDLAMFNISMSDAELTNNMRKEITPTSQYFDNLLGWWPGNEASGTTISDMSGKGNNFIANSNVTRSPFEDLAANISPLITPASYRVIINSVDIPKQIYQWMAISPETSWGLDGKVWKILYKDVRN